MPAEETYRVVNFIDGLVPPSVEMPLTALTGHPYLEHVAVLGIYNDMGSNVIINIKRVVSRPVIGRQATLPQAFQFQRITGVSGGDDIVPKKMDTNTPNLPSQILIREDPASVTTTGGVIRQIMDMTLMNLTRALEGLPDKSLGQFRYGFDSAQVLDSGYCNSATQGWVLREGEGLALSLPSTYVPVTYRLSVIFTTEDGTYFMGEAITADPGRPPSAILNGIGSGKTVTIRLIELQEVGDDSMPYFSIEKIDDMRGGVNTIPMPMDTQNSLPAAVIIRSNPIIHLAGYKFGAIMVNPSLRRCIPPIFGKGETTGINWAESAYAFTPIENPNANSIIELREGQGMAIIKKNASALARTEIVIEFTKTPVAVGGLTETIVAREFPMSYVKAQEANELRSKVG